MRTIIVVLFLLLYTIVSLPMYLIGFILGKMDPKKKVRMSQRFVAGGFRCILFLSGVKVTVKGKENQIHDKAALYVFNHRSFFDIVVGYATAPIPSAFVSKKEIAKVPMISWWMKYLNCLFFGFTRILRKMLLFISLFA